MARGEPVADGAGGDMKCQYRCQSCGHKFDRDNPGPVECPKCQHFYIDWLNSAEYAKPLERRRKIGKNLEYQEVGE